MLSKNLSQNSPSPTPTDGMANLVEVIGITSDAFTELGKQLAKLGMSIEL